MVRYLAAVAAAEDMLMEWQGVVEGGKRQSAAPEGTELDVEGTVSGEGRKFVLVAAADVALSGNIVDVPWLDHGSN